MESGEVSPDALMVETIERLLGRGLKEDDLAALTDLIRSIVIVGCQQVLTNMSWISAVVKEKKAREKQQISTEQKAQSSSDNVKFLHPNRDKYEVYVPAKDDLGDNPIQSDSSHGYGIIGGISITKRNPVNNISKADRKSPAINSVAPASERKKISTKRCKGECGEEKPVTEFYENSRYPDGYVALCKTCMARRRRNRVVELANDGVILERLKKAGFPLGEPADESSNIWTAEKISESAGVGYNVTKSVLRYLCSDEGGHVLGRKFSRVFHEYVYWIQISSMDIGDSGEAENFITAV